MIDKFEWKNVEMEQALLDYVDKMAQIYVRPVDECNDVNITYTTRTLSATDLIKQLKEKAFDEFKMELAMEESKQIDQLTSYTFGIKKQENDN